MSILKVGAISPNSGTKVNITGSTLLVTTASGHFSGSYEGDGSRLEGVAGFPFTGSGQISGSLLVTGSSALAVRVSGSTALTGSLFVSGTVSGSFIGDGSGLTGLATNLTVDGDTGTQDVSLTADDLQILGTANEISTTVTKISNDVKVTLGLPDTVAVTASVATRANALAPTVTATSASVAARATTLSAQATSSFADVAGTVHDGNITNAKLANDSVTIGSTEIDLGATAATLTGLTSISAITASFVLQTFESSSTVITSGSNIFGDKANDIQQITGSLLQTGSMIVKGNISSSVGGFSGSFQGDGTLLTGVIASGSIQSASIAARANSLSPTVTATSASTAILAQTASVAIRANALAPTTTASFADSATTASHTSGTASIANIATYTSEWILGANGSSDYTFTGPGFTGSTADPDIYLIRGQQYKFINKSGGHPFRIQTTVNGSAGTQYNNGITNNDAGNNETLTFNVSMEAPEVLYYQCTSHAAMGGPIYILDTSPVSSSFATSASIATTAQTASVSLRANALAPTVTATSASTAINAQTASVALRANALAPTVTATSASVAARATTLSAAATASFANISTLSRAGSGSFSGSFQGSGANLTGVGGFPHTGSAAISGTLNITGSGVNAVEVSGSLVVTGSAFVTSLTETSALRYKKSVKDINRQADDIYQLRPVHFTWRNNNKKDFGLIAEEVQEIYPELVTNGEDGSALGISYTKLTALLLKTIQGLNERIEKLENKN